MDNYIKTIINGLKVWAGSQLTRLEASVSKLSGNLDALGSKITSLTSKVAKAQTTANNAQSTANTAQSTANTAQSTANTAQTTANEAQTTANEAKSAASTAQITANNAKSAAATAQSTASAKLDKNAGVASNSLSINKAGSGSDYSEIKLTPAGIPIDKKLRLEFGGSWRYGSIVSGDTSKVILKNVNTPEDDSDAANKAYVDAAVADTISEERVNELIDAKAVSDEHINELIDAKLGVIENGSY